MKTTKDFPEFNSYVQNDVYQYPNPFRNSIFNIRNSIFNIRNSIFKNNLINKKCNLRENRDKKSVVLNMPQYQPISEKQHTEYSDYLLSLLFKDESITKKPKTVLGENKAAELLSNIPNPFYDKTTIRYAANDAGHIRVRITDYSGRLVSIRDEGWKEPGQYKFALTSENLVSGVYFCTIESNGMRTDSQKISVMK